MKVSFGAIRYRKECKEVSQKQEWMAKMAKKAFELGEKEYEYGADRFGKELTLAQFLKNKKGVDVEIIARPKNSILVALKKPLFDSSGTQVASLNVKYSGQKIETLFNVDRLIYPLEDYKKQLAKFVRKCLTYAKS